MTLLDRQWSTLDRKTGTGVGLEMPTYEEKSSTELKKSVNNWLTEGKSEPRTVPGMRTWPTQSSLLNAWSEDGCREWRDVLLVSIMLGEWYAEEEMRSAVKAQRCRETIRIPISSSRSKVTVQGYYLLVEPAVGDTSFRELDFYFALRLLFTLVQPSVTTCVTCPCSWIFVEK